MINLKPFFILSNPRSGSSLLRIICESHSNITVPPESGFMEWRYSKYKNWDRDHNRDPNKVNEFIGDLLTSKKIETWKLSENEIQSLIQENLPASYSELIALIYFLYGKQRKKKIDVWGDKNNYYINKTELLNKLYPEAKYIHLIRDGRDVAVSYLAIKKINTSSKYVPKLVDNIKDIADEWKKNNETLRSFFKSIPSDRVLRIRFEDLIQNLTHECQRITSFLNVPFDSRMLRYYEMNKSLELEPKETLDWKKKTLLQPDKKNIGKYKKELTKYEINLFNTIAKESLNFFNYDC